MNVGELIEELRRLDPNLLVVLQKDEEGNGYRKLLGVDSNAVFVEPDEVRLRVLDDADRKRGFTDEDLAPGAPPCVVLFP